MNSLKDTFLNVCIRLAYPSLATVQQVHACEVLKFVECSQAFVCGSIQIALATTSLSSLPASSTQCRTATGMLLELLDHAMPLCYIMQLV